MLSPHCQVPLKVSMKQTKKAFASCCFKGTYYRSKQIFLWPLHNIYGSRDYQGCYFTLKHIFDHITYLLWAHTAHNLSNMVCLFSLSPRFKGFYYILVFHKPSGLMSGLNRSKERPSPTHCWPQGQPLNSAQQWSVEQWNSSVATSTDLHVCNTRCLFFTVISVMSE